jgi:mannosyltransferase
VPEAIAQRSAGRRTRFTPAAWLTRLALATRALPPAFRDAGLVIALGAALFELTWRLGASSLFVDEVSSWYAADASLGVLLHRVRVLEVAPPAYYLLLHGWIRLFGSDTETVMRALSAIAALLLVAAIYWVGRLLANRLVGFLAALLAAVSPLVVEYGQEVRAYAWAMLAVTAATGAVLQAERSPRRRGPWLAFAAVAAVASLWLHYSAILVIAPLAVLVGVSAGLRVQQRARFIAAAAIGGLLVLPILISQLQLGNENAIGPYAKLTFYNLKRVVGAPFDRTYPVLTASQTDLGAILVIVALALLFLPRARARLTHSNALVALAGIAPLALVVLTLAGKHVLISRYDAVAVPFMVIAVAASVEAFPPAGVIVVLLALYIAVPASRLAHHADHAYPDTRTAVGFVAHSWRPGEVLVAGIGYPGLGASLLYYVKHFLPNDPMVARLKALPALLTLRRIPQVAVITAPVGPIGEVGGAFAKAHWRVTAVRQIAGTVPMQVFVATPTG